MVGEHVGAFETVQEKREAFRVVENHMANRHELEIDAEAAKDSRRRASGGAGASPPIPPGLEPEAGPETPDDLPAPDEEYFLDSEFVAIYW